MGFSKFGFLVALFAMYALLGCIMDGAGMIVLTVPCCRRRCRNTTSISSGLAYSSFSSWNSVC